MRRQQPNPMLVYCYAVGAIGVIASIYCFSVSPVRRWDHIALLALLAFVAEWAAFELPSVGSVSLAFAMDFAALLVGGPAGATIVALAGSGVILDLRNRKPLAFVVFNMGQLALSVQAGWIAYAAAGGELMLLSDVSTTDYPRLLPAILLSAIALHVVNSTLFSVCASLKSGESFFSIWKGTLQYFISFVMLTLLGFVLAQMLVVTGVGGALLLVVPFVIARQVFSVYQEMTAAYSETVRSLVTALEAKDSYTRGHSVRVAGYARLLAAGSGMPPSAVDRLEFAALLHDIGKIAIRNSVLSKATPLTDEEYDEIREHPESGRNLLDEIEFLSDVVPVVYQHHERLDGRGYPRGLQAPAISKEARILAVADSFDAMTSDRSYRAAMSYEEALAELRDKQGTQFDLEVVEMLTSCIPPDLVREITVDSLKEPGTE